MIKVAGTPDPDATSNTANNYDVTYTITVRNTGNDVIDDLSLVEDFNTHFGGAFENLVGTPTITAQAIGGGAASGDTTVNANTSTYNGNTVTELFDTGTSQLGVGDEVVVSITVEVDPDDPLANLVNGALRNSAVASGTDSDGSAVQDTSDDNTDADNTNSDTGNNNPDSPTDLAIADITTLKQVLNVTDQNNGTGYFNVEMQITLTNTGSTDLNNLDLRDVLNDANNFGGTYVSTVPSSLTITTTGVTSPPGINDGGTGTGGWIANPAENILDGTGVLESGDSIVVRFTVTVDPDAVGGVSNENLSNQAVGSGQDSGGNTVTDNSDDPTDLDNTDDNGDNEPDAPTQIDIHDIAVAKQVDNVVATAAGAPGNFDVTYVVVVENTGTVDLENIQLTEDLVAEFSAAGFVNIVNAPSITTTALAGGGAIPAGDIPTLNGAWNGTAANSGIFTGTDGLLNPGDSVTLTFTVEVNTAAAAAANPGGVTNQIVGSGRGVSTGITTTDLSDAGTNPNSDNGSGDEDDPTPLSASQLRVAKSHGTITGPNAAGDYTVPVTITIENTGTDTLNNLSLIENLRDNAQFGDAFISVDTPVITLTSGTGTPPGANALWTTADTSVNVFNGTGSLDAGGELTVTFNVVVDPDQGGTSRVLDNTAIASGRNPGGDTVTDESGADTPTTPGGTDNDSPTPLEIPEVSLQKSLVGSVLASDNSQGNYDVTYRYTLTNTGSTVLENPSIVDNIGAQFGGAFVRVVDMNLADDITVAGSTGIGGNATYAGGTDNLLDGNGSLQPGQSLTIELTVEVDPDGDPSALNTNGQLENQATGSGTFDPTGDNVTVTDNSDDPGLPGNDDKTLFSVADVTTLKQVTGITDNGNGTFDVGFRLTLTNTGSLDLDNLSLVDDLQAAGNLGGTVTAITVPVLDSTGISATNGGSAPAGVNGAWALGNTSVNILDNTGGVLAAGDSIVVTFTVTLDPDRDGSSDEGLSNQAIGSGDDPGNNNVTDNSDDPADLTNDDPDMDNNPDDPTDVIIPDLAVAKQVTGVTATATSGQFEVVYVVVVENTGTVDLENIQLTEDLNAHFGAGFIGIKAGAGPTITATELASTGGSIPAGDIPTLNGAWNGTAGNSGIFTGTDGLLNPGDSVTLSFTVIIDTTTATGTTNQILGAGVYDPGGANTTTTDLSDNGASPNGDNGSGGEDDPTPLSASQLRVAKSHGTITGPNAAGDYTVPVTITIENTGTDTLNNLSLIENLRDNAQFGDAFISVDTPVITLTSGTGTPPGANALWTTADTSVNVFNGTGSLDAGGELTVTFNVVVDPDQGGTSRVLDNTAIASGRNPGGDTVTDESGADTPTTAGGGDNDTPTPLEIPEVSTQKTVVGTPVVSGGTDFGNYNVTYEYTLTNTGTTTLENPSIEDDIDAQFGAAFVRVVNAPTIQAGSAAGIGANAAYDGGDTAGGDELLNGSGDLEPGESVTVRVTVQIDPDGAPTALNANGQLENQATGRGTFDPDNLVVGDEVTVSDDSDNDLMDGIPDDPTNISIADISVEKTVANPLTDIVPAATSGTPGNYDVTYTFTVTNIGTEDLSDVTVQDDIASQLGSAFVAVRGISVTNVDATTVPTVNTTYDGTASSQMLTTAANLLESGQSFTISLIVEVDPDAAGANFDTNGNLANNATATADGENSGADSATDTSDNGSGTGLNTDTDGDGTPDDPTLLRIGALSVTKTVNTPVPANQVTGSSGAVGNYVVDYTITVANTGNDTVNNLSLVENLQGHFGAAFVGLIGTPTINATDVGTPGGATANVQANGTAYDGNANSELFNTTVSRLGAKDSVTVVIRVEVDPDAAGAILNSGALENSAVASGQDSNLRNVSDTSDNGSTVGPNTDTDGNNTPDDPTVLSIADLIVTKQVTNTVAATSGTVDNFDVTYTFTVTNIGTETLSSLSLVDDLQTQLGGAFVGVVTAPNVTAPAGSMIDANAAYDGTNDLLDGAASDVLNPRESFTVTVTVEIDPDATGAVLNATTNALENTARGTGTGENGGSATSDSDNGTGVGGDTDDDNDGKPDDPTTLQLGAIEVLKSVTGSTAAASGIAGNTDVTYQITVRNAGNGHIDNLGLDEDLNTQFGTGFVRVVGTPSFVAGATSSASANPVTFNGNTVTELLDTTTSELAVGETIVITLVVEVDPDAAGVVLNTDGDFENSVVANGEFDPDGSFVINNGNEQTVSDTSDDPTSSLPGPDDPTVFTPPSDDPDDPEDPVQEILLQLDPESDDILNPLSTKFIKADPPLLEAIQKTSSEFIGDNLSGGFDTRPLQGFSLRFSLSDNGDGSFLFNLRQGFGDSDEGAGLNDELTIESLVNEETLFVDVTYKIVSNPDLSVSEYKASMLNGDPLPSWFALDKEDGLMAGEPPAGEETLFLRIEVVLSDGTTIVRYVKVEVVNGEISLIEDVDGVQQAQGRSLFSSQLASAS